MICVLMSVFLVCLCAQISERYSSQALFSVVPEVIVLLLDYLLISYLSV